MKFVPNVLRERGKKLFCISITVTGRCNANCTYCHFFARRERTKIAFDIAEEVFYSYLLVIKEIFGTFSKFSKTYFTYRFSGGEPLVLGNRLFELAKIAYKVTKVKPYVLTNGKAIDEKFIKVAKNSPISHLYVSIENPIAPDPGAPDPFEVIAKIKKFNSKRLPILPGVVVIKNEYFKNLFEIAKFFYKELGSLPTFSEQGYALFIPPTREQLEDLYENIVKVIANFYGKSKIILFPSLTSVSSLFPEFFEGYRNIYILGLDLENKYKITRENIKEKSLEILRKFDESYPAFKCPNKKCEWYSGCKRVLKGWLEGWRRLPPEESIKSYCQFKKTVYSATSEGLKILKKQ
jgi:MoaA/NifB/PqqE/SkfB family radical SAM enzyme